MKKNQEEKDRLVNFCGVVIKYISLISDDSEIFNDLMVKIDWQKAPMQAVYMAVNDMVEWSLAFSKAQIAEIDLFLKKENLPTLTSMKCKNYRKVRKILCRGKIKNKKERNILNIMLQI